MSHLRFTLARPIWSRLINGGSDGMSGFCGWWENSNWSSLERVYGWMICHGFLWDVMREWVWGWVALWVNGLLWDFLPLVLWRCGWVVLVDVGHILAIDWDFCCLLVVGLRSIWLSCFGCVDMLLLVFVVGLLFCLLVKSAWSGCGDEFGAGSSCWKGKWWRNCCHVVKGESGEGIEKIIYLF